MNRNTSRNICRTGPDLAVLHSENKGELGITVNIFSRGPFFYQKFGDDTL